MTIVTKDPHTWFVTEGEDGTQTIYNNETLGHAYPMAFQVNFSDTPTPQTNTVTLYNLSKEHKDFYHRKMHCYLAFNWGKEKKILAEGYISKIDMEQHDGVTDTQVISFTEGNDYSNVKARKLKVSKTKKVNKYKHVKVKEKDRMKKTWKHWTTVETYKTGPKKGQHYVKHHRRSVEKLVKGKTRNKRIKYRGTKTVQVNKTFRKGTSYKKLIQGIASQSGIKISKLDLAKNPTLKKNFTAKGKPLTLIKNLLKKTGSKMTYVRGKLEIVNPKGMKRTWFEIDDKDLIQPPSYNEDNSDDDDGKGTWEITVPLVPEITTNVGVIMKSKYLKGKFYVKAGQHSSDGENPQTQCSLVSM